MVTTMLVATENNISLLDSSVILALTVLDFQSTLISTLLNTIHTLLLINCAICLIFRFLHNNPG